ncbi:MAG: hypothetical protein CM15mP58_21920 [Burkholderiaceae bacterium]|nr:MAG: hypothetical protein CM15mP58_21920 [Burkholderiaceae bacterium]
MWRQGHEKFVIPPPALPVIDTPAGVNTAVPLLSIETLA